MTITRRWILALLAGPALAPASARAQGFPTRPISLVVAYPAGGPTDAIARTVAHELSMTLGHNVIVRNEAGASGAVGTRAVARAEPNGHICPDGRRKAGGVRRCRSGNLQGLGILLAQPHVRRSGLRKGMQNSWQAWTAPTRAAFGHG